MKIILLKDVRGVGRKYDVKDVGDGYAMNKLIPQKYAEPATQQAIAKIQALKEKNDTMRKVDEELARKNIEQLESQGVEMIEQANEQGHLFAGVHTKEITSAIKTQLHLDIDPEWILLEKPIKTVGETVVPVEWNGVSGSFTLSIKKQS